MNTSLTRVLLIEDERLIAEAARAMLLSLGYTFVGMAHNLPDAIALLRSTAYDIVLTDIRLDQGGEGIELGKMLRDELHKPFIYITAFSDRTTVAAAKETKPEAYLLKPFTEDDLYTAIEIAMAKQAQAAPEPTITLSSGQLQYKVAYKDILYVQVENVYLEVHTASRKYILRESLESFLLHPGAASFVKTHRSWAANLVHVQASSNKHLLVGQVQIPISRSHLSEVSRRLY